MLSLFNLTPPSSDSTALSLLLSPRPLPSPALRESSTQDVHALQSAESETLADVSRVPVRCDIGGPRLDTHADHLLLYINIMFGREYETHSTLNG